MMNWDHLQDLSKDDLIARVILGEWQQVNWERAYNEMKQRAEAAERKAEEAARDADAAALYGNTGRAHGFVGIPKWSELAEDTRQIYRDAIAAKGEA